MRDRHTYARIGERSTVYFTIKNQYPIFPGNKVLNRLLTEVGLALAVPYKLLTVPIVVVIMPGPARNTDITEDEVVLVVAMVSVQPVATPLVLGQPQNFINIVSGVLRANNKRFRHGKVQPYSNTMDLSQPLATPFNQNFSSISKNIPY